MGKVRMVAVDMDGTFLSDAKRYNSERFQRIYQQMREREIKFVVASGNQYYQLRSFFPAIADEIAFVAENGARVLDQGEELLCGEFTRQDINALLDTLRQGNYPGLRFILCGRESAWVLPGVDERWLEVMRHYCHRLERVESLEDINDKLFKIALNLSDDYVQILMADIVRLHEGVAAATTSGHGSVDLIIPGFHKANGLALLQKRWGIENHEVLAFGDGGNDLEMLAQSGFSFAMENAPQRVKDAARYQAPHNNSEGVLAVMEQMLAGQGPFN